MEDKSLAAAKRQFIISLILLAIAVMYLLSPIDIIPDVLFPAGYIDDIPLLIATVIYTGYSYRKLKKKQKQLNS
jgi:uncharacterized membrane protein YkvA (DUF1232 family)